jgi:CRISPR/Cas system-associated exonuclease Cas4 (RecB family)
MRPKTLSASALQTASGCMRRFEAEYIQYGRGMQNVAASIGTSVHGGLEEYVKAVFLEKTDAPTLELLLHFYHNSYEETFKSSDRLAEEYKDGQALLENWFERTDFSGRRVLTTEVKKRYPIPLSDGSTLPFSYIFDRHDILESEGGDHEIVDYKTNRFPMSAAELKSKVQARMYGLLTQIEHPEIDRVWVTFDLLRHPQPTTVLFTKQDNFNTWTWLIEEIARILATPKHPKPTLNPECNFCVLKTRCPALLKNIEVGGVFGMSDIELVDKRVELAAQAKAAASALEELDSVLGPKLRPGDGSDLAIEGTEYRAFVKAASQRRVDEEMIARVVPDIITDYMKPSRITMGDFDRMLKDERLTPENKKTLKSLVRKVTSNPSIALEKR